LSATDDAASLGCASQYGRVLDCFATVADPCAFDACAAEIDLLFDCIDGGGATGCAPSGTAPATGNCVATCQEQSSCPGVEPVDCATACSDAATQAAMYGCSAELNRYYGCVSTCTNLCEFTTGDCSVELDAFADCYYCGMDSSNPDCAL
jgi:hypothetical protein